MSRKKDEVDIKRLPDGTSRGFAFVKFVEARVAVWSIGVIVLSLKDVWARSIPSPGSSKLSRATCFLTAFGKLVLKLHCNHGALRVFCKFSSRSPGIVCVILCCYID